MKSLRAQLSYRYLALAIIMCGVIYPANAYRTFSATTLSILAQAATPTATPAPTASPTPPSSANPSGGNATEWHPWAIAGFALLLVLFPFSLMWTDIMKAYEFAHETRRDLIAKFSADKLTLDQLKVWIAEFDTSPPGIPGLARATLALTLLLLIGLIIIYFVFVCKTDITGGVEKLLTALTTAFASVVAFYFGTRAAQGAQDGASSPSGTTNVQGSQPNPPPPNPPNVTNPPNALNPANQGNQPNPPNPPKPPNQG